MVRSHGFLLNGEVYYTVALIQGTGKFCTALFALQIFMTFHKLSVVE